MADVALSKQEPLAPMLELVVQEAWLPGPGL
jgi:hypothetical protein